LLYFNQANYFDPLLKHVERGNEPELVSKMMARVRAIILDFQRVDLVDSAATEGLIELWKIMNQYVGPGNAEWYFANVIIAGQDGLGTEARLSKKIC